MRWFLLFRPMPPWYRCHFVMEFIFKMIADAPRWLGACFAVWLISGVILIWAAASIQRSKQDVPADPSKTIVQNVQAAPTTEVSTVKPAERIEINATPEQIWKTYEGKATAYQADTLVKNLYLGKWITTELPIDDIADSMGEREGAIYLSLVPKPNRGPFYRLFAYFDKASVPKVNYLEKGTVVRVRGQIIYVDETWIRLTHCELLQKAGSEQPLN